MKTLLPKTATTKNTLQTNSTHIAIHIGTEIQIWTFGISWINDDNTESVYPAEKLWTIPEGDQDDLLAIFERLDENNRCNVAEANAEFQKY